MGAPLVYLLQNNGYAISTPSAARGLWSESAAARARVEIAAEIDEAQRKAAEFPRPTAADVYDHAYGAPPPRVQGHRRETLAAGD